MRCMLSETGLTNRLLSSREKRRFEYTANTQRDCLHFLTRSTVLMPGAEATLPMSVSSRLFFSTPRFKAAARLPELDMAGFIDWTPPWFCPIAALTGNSSNHTEYNLLYREIRPEYV
jgi:hypothetical protein